MLDELTDKRLHLLIVDPPTFDGLNCRIVAENDDVVVVYIPGRTVYVDSVQGSQYSPSTYVVCFRGGSAREVENTVGIMVEEVLRFDRSV